MLTTLKDFSSRNDSEGWAALRLILPKLETTLGQENEILESREISDHEPFITRKNVLLRELMTVQRRAHSNTMPDELREMLARIRILVTKNHKLLEAQLAAMAEITDILTGAALAEDQDGTYTRHR